MGKLPGINSSCEAEEAILFSQKKNVKIQSYSESICSFNFLVQTSVSVADMLSSCYMKTNHINLRRYKHNLFLAEGAYKATDPSVLATHLPLRGERCTSYVQSESPGAVTGRGRTIGVLGFFTAATRSCGNAKSVPGLLCLIAEGRNCDSKAVHWQHRKLPQQHWFSSAASNFCQV